MGSQVCNANSGQILNKWRNDCVKTVQREMERNFGHDVTGAKALCLGDGDGVSVVPAKGAGSGGGGGAQRQSVYEKCKGFRCADGAGCAPLAVGWPVLLRDT